jgi:hypothetical protein
VVDRLQQRDSWPGLVEGNGHEDYGVRSSNLNGVVGKYEWAYLGIGGPDRNNLSTNWTYIRGRLPVLDTGGRDFEIPRPD